jgi:hypothetical protein
MPLTELKKQVRALGPAQRAELRAYIDGLGQFIGRPDSGSPAWILHVLEDSCVRLGLGGFLNTAARNDVSTHSPMLVDYLARGCPGCNLVIQRAVLATGLDLLYRDLAGAQIPVNATILARNLPRVPAVMDKAFPGYAQFGMLAKSVRGENA